MTVKRKNKKIRTRKNTRKPMRGGLFGFFSEKTPNSTVSTQPSQLYSVKPANTLIEKAEQANSNAKKSVLTMSSAANTQLAATTASAALVGTVASNIGYGAIAGLTATGVGIPLAGAIAGALLIANKLSNMYLANLKLKTIMFDTMSILTNCYKLNELIGKAYEIIQIKLKTLGKKPTDLVTRIGIDSEIQTHILSKVNDVTAYLLNITEDSVLKMLLEDTDIKNRGFMGPVQTEANLRKNNNVKNFFNKAQRGINRFIYVSETKSDIIENLSLINSFFIIIKSQYDFALQLYEHEFGEKWKDVLTEIESTEEYQNYLIPVQNLSQEANEITLTETEIGEAAKDVINAVKENDNNQNQEEQQKIALQNQATNQATI